MEKFLFVIEGFDGIDHKIIETEDIQIQIGELVVADDFINGIILNTETGEVVEFDAYGEQTEYDSNDFLDYEKDEILCNCVNDEYSEYNHLLTGAVAEEICID